MVFQSRDSAGAILHAIYWGKLTKQEEKIAELLGIFLDIKHFIPRFIEVAGSRWTVNSMYYHQKMSYCTRPDVANWILMPKWTWYRSFRNDNRNVWFVHVASARKMRPSDAQFRRIRQSFKLSWRRRLVRFRSETSATFATNRLKIFQLTVVYGNYQRCSIDLKMPQ